MFTVTQMINLAKLGLKVILAYIRTSTLDHQKISCVSTSDCLQGLDRQKRCESDSTIETSRKRAMERVLIWSVFLCWLTLTSVRVLIMDEIALYPPPHLWREIIWSFTEPKLMQLKQKQHIADITVYSRSKLLFPGIC